MQDKPLRSVARCARCGKAKNQHRAFSLDCPNGRRTPTGYMSFGPGNFVHLRREGVEERSIRPGEETRMERAVA
jgi:hypothetical protein